MRLGRCRGRQAKATLFGQCNVVLVSRRAVGVNRIWYVQSVQEGKWRGLAVVLGGMGEWVRRWLPERRVKLRKCTVGQKEWNGGGAGA